MGPPFSLRALAKLKLFRESRVSTRRIERSTVFPEWKLSVCLFVRGRDLKSPARLLIRACSAIVRIEREQFWDFLSSRPRPSMSAMKACLSPEGPGERDSNHVDCKVVFIRPLSWSNPQLAALRGYQSQV